MIQSLRFIFKFIWLEKKLFFSGLVFTFLLSGLTWAGPLVIAHLINEGISKGQRQVILTSLLVLWGVECARLLSAYLSQRNYSVLGQNVIERVREYLVNHLLSLPVSYFDRVSSGGMMTRVVNDVNALTDFFQSGFVSVLGNVASLIAIFIGLFGLSFKLGLVLFLAFLPFLYACTLFSDRLKRCYEVSRNRLAELNAMLADFLFGMKTIRALGISPGKFKELGGQILLYADAQMAMVKSFALFHPTVTLGTGTLLLILIEVGYPMVHDGTLSVGDWVAILSYIVLIAQPLVEITDRWNFFLAGLTSVARIQEVLDEKPAQSGNLIPDPMKEIEFRNITFRYGDQGNALSQLNLTIRRSDWIGVYGESGSGKSTLLQMIYGFYIPTSGELNWNGSPYPIYWDQGLRSHFGVVEQFPFLFVGTVEENITFFGKNPMDVSQLLAHFQGYPLITSLLKMRDFKVIERGENLSMGQRQMITFLRAYVVNPSIWILDEATAFFDETAEKEVLRALEELRETGITVIQVAHRPEALKGMNRLIQIRQGQAFEIRSLSDYSPDSTSH